METAGARAISEIQLGASGTGTRLSQGRWLLYCCRSAPDSNCRRLRLTDWPSFGQGEITANLNNVSRISLEIQRNGVKAQRSGKASGRRTSFNIMHKTQSLVVVWNHSQSWAQHFDCQSKQDRMRWERGSSPKENWGTSKEWQKQQMSLHVSGQWRRERGCWIETFCRDSYQLLFDPYIQEQISRTSLRGSAVLKASILTYLFGISFSFLSWMST